MLTKLNDAQAEHAAVAVDRPDETRRMRAWLDEKVMTGKKKPFAEVVTLTPLLAQLLLEINPINRTLSGRNKYELERDIAEGRFAFNGESIVVSSSGTLNDGQHRCAMVVSTGTAIQTVIVFGPEEETRFTIDTGRSKSVANLLHMQGRVYTNTLAAATSLIIQYKQHNQVGYTVNAPPKSVVLKAVAELEGISESVSQTAPAVQKIRSHSPLAMCHWVIWDRATRELADEFMMKLIEGESLRRGDPILYCRNKLIGMGRLHPAAQRIEMIFKTWNAWRKNETVHKMVLSGGKLPKLVR